MAIPEPRDLWVLLGRWGVTQTGASLWRKQAIVDVGGWKPDLPCCQEHELYLRLHCAGKRFSYYPGEGAIWRQWGEHTVSKMDKPGMRRHLMQIEQQTEDILREKGELTPIRHWAINQCRFEMARMAWNHDQREAMAIIQCIRRSQPNFQPGGIAAPRHYQLAFRTLGFRAAETLAKLIRPLRKPPTHASQKQIPAPRRDTPSEGKGK